MRLTDMAFIRRWFGTTYEGLNTPDEDFTWGKKTYDTLVEKVKGIKSLNELSDGKLNLLVIGPQGHGKSSLLNSVASVSIGTKTTVANAGAGQLLSDNVTVKLKKIDFPGKFQNFKFFDVKGLTKMQRNAEVFVEDLKNIISGHIKDGYKFKEDKAITKEDSDYYIEKPTIDKKIHGVIIVVDIQEAYDIHSKLREDIKSIIGRLNELNCPVSVFLTKADLLCPCVRDDISNIYNSKKVIEAVNKVYSSLGVRKQNIHPVVNFEDDVQFRWKEQLPLLVALRSCLATAQSHLYNMDEASRLPVKK